MGLVFLEKETNSLKFLFDIEADEDQSNADCVAYKK